MGIQVLLVEDDETISGCVHRALESACYEVSHARTGEEAFFMATAQHFDVLILDLGLPGRDGLQVLDALRKRENELPVLILSARSEVEDRVAGLQAGADDYLTKPFSMVELEARLHALLRRGRAEVVLRLAVHDLAMDIALRNVTRASKPVELTTLEFDLLELLMRRAHGVVSRDTLAREVWKEVKRATPMDNVIDVHIGRLRKKIDQPGTRPL
ncbi:MAG: response regulator transcription factor, partial [Methylibium sp.]|nr:response regulator transcription factor [Methylibium sp.]